ncbi:hypothetical protein B0H16DRAFT_1900285 [Mycena metata]|uniref:DUF6534 domain-containing protein n=1 Tax=Mycena metata TaxID=1033252 RepID=A0AAD7H4C2_9AGAR|nr:hypothetical protein B0H16DRAFT_1900285 [Mycena metata]
MATPPPVRLLLGPILIGSTLNTCLYGVVVTQFWAYYSSKSRRADPKIIRYLVTWEFVIDTFHSAVAVYFLWIYMVDNFLNAPFLQTAPWTVSAIPIVTALSACPIQLFLAWRVFQMSKSWYAVAFLVVLTAAHAGTATTISVLSFQISRFNDGVRLTPLVDAWLAVSTVNDLAVTVLLVYYLNKSRTGLSKTNSVITRLTRSAVESAAFATFFSIMVLITFTRFPSTGLHLLFSQPMGRIYTLITVVVNSSTLLSTLNRREALRDRLGGIEDMDNSLQFQSMSVRSGNLNQLAVKVTAETTTDDHSYGKSSSVL